MQVLEYLYYTVAAQNAVTKRDLGVVTSSTMYFRFIGGVIGLAVLGVIVNMTLKLNLQNTTVHVSSSLDTVKNLGVFEICVLKNNFFYSCSNSLFFRIGT